MRRSAACLLLLGLAACSSLGATGPSAKAISQSEGALVGNAPIKVIDIDQTVARRLEVAFRDPPLSQILGDAAPTSTVIGVGDTLQVSILESPPAVLFGGRTGFGGSGSPGAQQNGGGQDSSIPEMMVDENGRIRIPFAGSIPVAGRTPPDVERLIASRLAGMAHDPQVTVRIAQNASATVAVVGAVGTSGRVPITPRGERVLDVLASSGGVTQPVDKITVQVIRGGRTAALPLERVIIDPAQNIRLAPGDVVTAQFQPFSFTAMGATNTTAEIPFESTGVSLAEAIGRVGGLKDERANIRGAFIFRLEDPSAVDPAVAAASPRTPEGRIPVIYRADLRNPATLFAAQAFPMRNKDILYVSSAPLTDFQRFVNILSSMAFTFIGLGNAVPR